jgi:hypothetical protein
VPEEIIGTPVLAEVLIPVPPYCAPIAVPFQEPETTVPTVVISVRLPVVTTVPLAFGKVYVLSVLERSATSMIPKNVAPADSRIFNSEEALLREISKAPVWFQSAVRAPRARVSAAPSLPPLPPLIPEPLVMDWT